MADDPKNPAPTTQKQPDPPPAPQKQPDAAPASGGVAITMERDYWPLEQPEQKNPLAVEEKRVRAGETVTLPADEAMNVIEAGIGKRARGG